MHTLKDLEEKSAPVVAKMLENADAITGIPGISKEHTEIYLDAPSFGACAHTMRYGLFEGYVTGSQDGQPVAPLMGNFKDYDGGAGDFQMGPVTFMLNYPDHCVLYRFIPRSLTETDMELVWFVREDAQEGVDYDVDKVTWLWHHTTLEDEYIITRNAAGVNSRFFEPGPYHRYHACLRARTKECALRTSEHFHTVDVSDVDIEVTARLRHGLFVEVQRHVRAQTCHT